MSALHRVATVLWAALRGRSHCWLSSTDRERAVSELDDASLVKWARWALTCCANYYTGEAERKSRSLQEVLTMHSVITLAMLTLRANATRSTFDVESITFRGEPKGDWRVTVEQIKRGDVA